MSSTNEQSAVAQRFLAVRIELGVSQQAFADRLGISLRAEQNYERGVRRLPADVLMALARAFSIDPLWVLDGPGDRPRRIVQGNGLDQEILNKAMNTVFAAIRKTNGQPSESELSHWVAAVYDFYVQNNAGTGAEELVERLIGARK